MRVVLSYGCFSGSRTSFCEFRTELAKLVGIDLTGMCGHTQYEIGLPWPHKTVEPLVIFLNQLDIRGHIPVGDIQPLLDRLRELLPLAKKHLKENMSVLISGLENALEHSSRPVLF